MAAKAKKAPKKKNGYLMPEPISAGEILTDLSKERWILGKSIGVGGFGEVYSAAPYTGKVPKTYPNVIKIEPHGNGPLFVEMHFYMKNCKPDDINNWQKKKKLSVLGMPRYIASGSHEYKSTKYRFLVIDRYGRDLWKIFVENNKQFPEYLVYKLVLQILDILEYIHSRNYVHADVKAENLLVDLNSSNQVYLVDFGLACRCTKNTELKVDPKKAHNGTLQYTSRDAHMGVPTKRGDIEVLSYNMIMWLCGSLPWEKIFDAVAVQKEKEKAFKDIHGFLSKCFCQIVPEAVQKFMTLLSSLKFNEEPPYEKFKEILLAGLKKLNCKPDGKLRLDSIDTTPPSASQSTKKSEDKSRKNPRRKQIDVPESPPRAVKYSRKSTVGVVIDKKRGNLKDVAAVLNEMDSEDEYDIQILKKAKKVEPKNNETTNVVPGPSRGRKLYNKDSETSDIFEPKSTPKKRKPRQKKPVASASNRKMKSLDDSETTSESEILSKGTKSRPRGKLTAANKAIKLNVTTESDEDMFDDA